jgi:hypothetical protein
MGGQGPIPYLVVSQYARDHGIVGEDYFYFRLLLDALDSEWLKHVAERDKAADKARDKAQSGEIGQRGR